MRAPRAADEERPYLLFLNGGPGMPSPRPLRAEGWLATALEDFHVVLLDQRGTGLSTPADADTLPARGDADAQAEYLASFRADSIVRDAEIVRERLAGAPWSVLGQSYGGFCVATYLSLAPEGVREAFVTGGLPPVGRSADEVYRALIARQARRLDLYFARYPDDRERWEAVTDRWLRTVGRDAGMSTSLEALHYLIEQGAGSLAFREGARQAATLAVTPLYALLHEAIYTEGPATRWAAQRMLDEHGAPVLPGEMILPLMFEDDPGLRPLAGVAEVLAAKDDWGALYDPARLERNEVPVFAAVYLDDPYVEAEFALATAELIRGTRTWATNEHQHDGLHAGDVLRRLVAMARGEA